MNRDVIIDGLISYCCLLVLITFHECAHAWTAMKCGDNTARDQGRVSLNPLVHMDMIGTVAFPLLAIVLGAFGSGLASFIIGWGKPVPVDLDNVRHRRRDDVLISLAGPAMNLALAVVIMGLAKLGLLAHSVVMIDMAVQLTKISLLLCFFNLLPIPPLDGSHLLKHLIGMSEETYFKLCQFSFIILIVAIQIPQVQGILRGAMRWSFNMICLLYDIP
jgi:Zn-dependent protease